MVHVLFVDDDAMALEELRRVVFASGARWDVSMASSGREAVSLIEREHYDAVVTDLKMPAMDGAELLTWVRDNHPSVMRVLMTGNADISFTAQLVPQAQQFLQKPLDPITLKASVERACELGRRLLDPDLVNTLGGVSELPRPSESILRLNSLVDNSDAGIDEVVEVVEHDMALTVKLFQLVNSASYGLSRNIQDVREAISYLGMNTVRNLAVSTEILRSVSEGSSEHSDMVTELHEKANEVSRIARQLVLGQDQANEAFVAGLLHDVGLLACVSYMPRQFRELRDAVQRSNLPVWDLELDIIGAGHADIGAILLDTWGLSFPIVEAVARHHDAPSLPSRRMDATHAVHIAHSIVASQWPDSALPMSAHSQLDTAYLKELGMLERVAGMFAPVTPDIASR